MIILVLVLCWLFLGAVSYFGLMSFGKTFTKGYKVTPIGFTITTLCGFISLLIVLCIMIKEK